MTTKYGMFLEHTYLRPGVPDLGKASSDGGAAKQQDPEEGPKDREHGLNMKAPVAKTGKLNDATFSKFLGLHQGDKYIDPLKARLQADAEKRKANVTETAFKPSSPMKKSTTPGDFFGTSGKIPYVAGTVEQPKKKGEVAEKPRGIYTSPAKKGTFGFNKFTLSERAGFKGVAQEYEYLHDPEGLLQQKKREAAEADHKARVSDLPFKPSNPAKKGGFGVPNTTISKGKGVAGEWEYVIVPPKEGEGGPSKAQADAGTPFKPSNAFASQRIEKIEYIHDPEIPKIEAAATRLREEQKRLAATGPWKPNMAYKTDMVRSIVKMNIR